MPNDTNTTDTDDAPTMERSTNPFTSPTPPPSGPYQGCACERIYAVIEIITDPVDGSRTRRRRGTYDSPEAADIGAQHFAGRDGSRYRKWVINGGGVLVAYHNEDPTDGETPDGDAYLIIEEPLKSHPVSEDYDLYADAAGTVDATGSVADASGSTDGAGNADPPEPTIATTSSSLL